MLGRMKVLRSWSTASKMHELHGGAITIGNFDGVHRGHEQVLADTRHHAAAVGGPAIAITFEPHPRAVLFPNEAPRHLCHLHERLELLAQEGMQAAFLLHFNPQMAALSAEDFVHQLHAALQFKHIHVGYDFAFGHDRQGHADTLRQIGARLGFSVSEAVPFELEGAVVSSSRIRSAVEAADFQLAETLLGRPFAISGHVGKGDQRGRLMGFPTANLDTGGLAHPAAGIYAVYAETAEKRWQGAAYLGYRPTFAGRTLVLETHVFDDAPDLYKQRLKVTFVKRIREDRAYRGAEALAIQIAKDCQQARAILAADSAKHPA